MNSFDVAVCAGLLIAVVTGFNTGLLRSAITILAYLFAMPIAVWATSALAPQLDGRLGSPLTQNSLLFFGTFLIAGMVLGKCARMGRGAWRGTGRPGRYHAGADLRPARSGRSPAGIFDRLAA